MTSRYQQLKLEYERDQAQDSGLKTGPKASPGETAGLSPDIIKQAILAAKRAGNLEQVMVLEQLEMELNPWANPSPANTPKQPPPSLRPPSAPVSLQPERPGEVTLFEQELELALQLFIRKNAEYGNAIQFTGVWGAIVQLIADAHKLKVMYQRPVLDTANIEDKLRDILVQAGIGLVMVRQDNWEGK
jgi:hypothetical protein